MSRAGTGQEQGRNRVWLSIGTPDSGHGPYIASTKKAQLARRKDEGKGSGDEIEKKSEIDEIRDCQSLPAAESQVERIKIRSGANNGQRYF